MMTFLVLTVIGQDRPGLVSDLSERITAHGGMWLDSRMASLAGKFAGLLLVSVPEHSAEALITSLNALQQGGLRLLFERGIGEPSAQAGTKLALELTGLDRPGVVWQVSEALARRKVTIQTLETSFYSASFSGENMFDMRATLLVPAGLDEMALRKSLEDLGDTLMVSISFA